MPRPVRTGDPAFAAAMRSLGYAPSTIQAYGKIVARWQASGLSGGAWLQRARERSTRGGAPTAGHKVYQKALLAWHTWKKLPAEALDLPRVVRYRRPLAQDALAPEAEDMLRGRLARGEIPEPCRTLAWILLAGGLRQSEARNVTLADVTVREGAVVLSVMGKGLKPRVVALPSEIGAALIAYLRGWRRDRPGPWLFPSPQGGGKPISRTALANHLGACGLAAGVRITPHTLRHTRATQMQEAGVPDATSGAVLGHASTNTTRRYQHPGIAAAADAVTKSWRR